MKTNKVKLLVAGVVVALAGCNSAADLNKFTELCKTPKHLVEVVPAVTTTNEEEAAFTCATYKADIDEMVARNVEYYHKHNK